MLGAIQNLLPGTAQTALGFLGPNIPGYREIAGLQRGLIANPSLGIRIEFQYNPEDIREGKRLNWNFQPILGVGQPLISYGGGDVRTKSFRILLDAHASPTVKGHVADDLDMIRILTIPFDITGTMTMSTPTMPPSGGPLSDLSRAAQGHLGSVASALPFSSPVQSIKRGPGRVSGVPPMVKIVYGGKLERGVVQSIDVQEVFHGTTMRARADQLCTRAFVDFEFIVIEDTRMMVHWRTQQP